MSEADKDRISDLPDSLLHHILSFLVRTDCVARTSVLSKRWNYIWLTVPTLHLLPRHYRRSEAEGFMDFVDGTLRLRNMSNIDKFFLRWESHLDESRIQSWISTVTKCNVKEVNIYLWQKHTWFIPPSLTDCESLISLELAAYPSILLPKYISFPRLKRLVLYRFEFSDESWNEELFSNSPALEELILDYCFVSMSSYCISIPTLKLLEIDDNNRRCCFNGCVLKIDAPRLVTFTYVGYVAKEFVLSSFPELVEATVGCFENNGDAQTRRLLQALTHVKCLTICDMNLQAIYSASNLLNNLLTFHNVKMVTIFHNLTTDQGLIVLLKAVPNLELLVFDEYMDDEIEPYKYSDEDDCDKAVGDGDEDVGTRFVEGNNNHGNEDEGDVVEAEERRSNDECKDNYSSEDDSWDITTEGSLFPHLKSVCFKQFVGNPREMKWVRHILRDAKALEKMTIHYYNCSARFVSARSENELMIEVPSFPRASPGCVIKFCS